MSLPPVTDSHCHLDHVLKENAEWDMETLIKSAADMGVNRLLNVCIELDQFDAVLKPAMLYPFVFASAGQHPCDTAKGLDYDRLLKCAMHDRVVAVGETGLDFYHDQSFVQQQKESFAQHMAISSQLKKPLIIHSRAAKQATIDMLESDADRDVAGVLHCFTEDWPMAKKAIDLGFYISFSGIITFKNAHELREVAKKVPLDRVLIETDAPYLAPVPHRGQCNQPAYVSYVGHALASLRFQSYETIAEATNKNFERLFKMALLPKDD